MTATLLCVDADRGYCEILARAFQAEGFRVHAAHDGDAALAAIRSLRPDLVTLAKALGNGLPIGALLVAEEAAGAFEPGDHGSTFGGNPVTCAAACAVVDEIDDGLLAQVRALEARMVPALAGLTGVVDARGVGLLLGIELPGAARPVLAACLERGLLLSSAGENVIRLTPPLTVSPGEVEHALAILSEVLA